MKLAQSCESQDKEFVVKLLGFVPDFKYQLPGLVLELADPANSNLLKYAKRTEHNMIDRIARVRLPILHY